MLALAPLLTSTLTPTFTCLPCFLHLHCAPFKLTTLISCISVSHSCVEPYNEPQHDLLRKSMLLVFHVCETFVVQLSSSDTHCLLCLSCTSQTILTPMLLFLFVCCTCLVSQAEYVLTSHTFLLHVCTSHSFCLSCMLVLNQTKLECLPFKFVHFPT